MNALILAALLSQPVSPICEQWIDRVEQESRYAARLVWSPRKERHIERMNEAAEMAPIAPEIGEFRAHYAGFFDPGFGVAEAGGGTDARAVLEVRGRDVPFILEDGQAAARLVYEKMTRRPQTLYGEAGSHYQAQRLKLSKHFKEWKA